MSEVYERTSRDEPRRTLMKLLYRCLITHRQIKKLTRVFKLNYKRNQLYLKSKQKATLVRIYEKSENERLENYIA